MDEGLKKHTRSASQWAVFWKRFERLATTRLSRRQDWDAAVCACFRGLLPTLKPRYAEVIRRIDLRGEARRQSLLN